MTEAQSRRIIVVLGMHRSGTSALAGLQQQLGVWMGNDLSPGDDWNVKGYFEDRALVAFNERLLADLGRRWDSLSSVAPAELSALATMPGLMDEACTLLERQFGRHRTIAIKDPRLCHLLPFWQGAFARCGLDERYVVAVRSPEAVCRSLWRRDGFGWSRSAWLWMGHTMAALEAVRQRCSMLIDFDDLLDDAPAVAHRLSAFCALGALSTESEAAVRAFVASELPTSPAGLPVPIALPELATEAFSILQRASRETASAAMLARSPHWRALYVQWEAMAERLQFADGLAATDISLPRLQQRLAQTEVGLADAQRLAMERLAEIQSLSTRVDITDRALSEAKRMALDRLQQIETLHARVALTDEALAQAQRLALERLAELTTALLPAEAERPPEAEPQTHARVATKAEAQVKAELTALRDGPDALTGPGLSAPVLEDGPPALRHNVDHLLHRSGQIFSYGWGFVPGRLIRRVVLHLHFRDGSSAEIDADYGRLREDVRSAFPQVTNAEHSGFLLMASDDRPLSRAVLRWELEDTTLETPFDLSSDKPKFATTANHYRALLRKGVALMRGAGAAALWRKAARYVGGRPRRASESEFDMLTRQLQGRPLAVVVDHDMGGGANIYRAQYVEERRALGDTVVLLSFHLASLQYFVEIFDDRVSRRISIDSPALLLPLTEQGDVRHVLYNCAVSFSEPFVVVDTLIALKRHRGAVLEAAIHDYFSVCPTSFLIDADGAFCGVPDPERCDQCLPAHRDGFVSISGIKDLRQWRKQWARLLTTADRVRLFSDSSYRLLRRGYPDMATDRWVVEPHALHTPQPRLSIVGGERMHIGVVGAIGKHKGAQIVSALALELAKRRLGGVAMTVIGTLDAKVPAGTVRITGAYEPGQLATLIEQSGANVFFFPSIMAETFSFVAHELVAMDLPFACFDFGAPADLARTYDKGLVIDSLDPQVVLERLEAFWQSAYAVNAP
jgi:hypothetical protein